MSILAWIILGGFAGWIAAAILGSRDGILMNILVGIVGAFLGGFIFSSLGGVGMTGFNFWSLFVAIVGAVIAILIVRAIRRTP